MDALSFLVSTRIAADLATLVFLKATILVLVVALAARLFRFRSAAARHRIWATGFLTLIALPLIEKMVPHWGEAILPYPAETMLIGPDAIETAPLQEVLAPSETHEVVATPPAREPPLASILLMIWWVGALVVTTGFVFDLIRAQALKRRCLKVTGAHALHRLLEQERVRMGIGRPVGLLLTQQVGLVATIGTIRPEIILGPDGAARPNDELRAILIHELAHIKRLDYPTHLLSTIAMPLYWPNPLVWWAKRRAAREREQACDDVVLNSGVGSPLYARVLLDFAVGQSGLAPAVGATTPLLRLSSTKDRIRAILDRGLDRRPLGAVAGAIVVAAMVGVSLTTGSLTVLRTAPGTGTSRDLVSALKHSDPSVRARAAQTLVRRDAGAVRVELEALLDDANSRVRLAALGGLVELANPASVPAMAHVLERPYDGGRGEHGFVLKYAMITLGKIGTIEAMRVLEQQLDHPEPTLRWLALETILCMPNGETNGRLHLERFAQSDLSEHNRRLAVAALAKART